MPMPFFCRLFFSFILISMPAIASLDEAIEEHNFRGTHFLASYLECDPEVMDNDQSLMEAMGEAVRASGAHILNTAYHVFEPNGVTMMFLLSESHATIHTYPEYRACFVDIFTCGDICQPEKFHQVLKAYLKPKKISKKIFLRYEDIEEKS